MGAAAGVRPPKGAASPERGGLGAAALPAARVPRGRTPAVTTRWQSVVPIVSFWGVLDVLAVQGQ